MDKPFDVTATVLMPDGSKTELAFNLFDVKREFPCPICSSIGDDENISVQSWSDHFARHYVENNRAGEINRAITEDMKTPIVVKGLRDDVAKYDRAVGGHAVGGQTVNADEYDRAVDRVIMIRPQHIPPHAYNPYGDMSEEQMLQLAMEESLRESEAAAALAKVAAESPVVRIEELPPAEFKIPAADDTNYTPLVDAVLVDTPKTQPVPAMTATTVPAMTATTVPAMTVTPVPATTVAPAAYPVRKKKVL